VGPEESSKRIGGALLTRIQTPLTVLEFRGANFQIHCIRIHNIAKSEVSME
jgi:hypothetical protein